MPVPCRRALHNSWQLPAHANRSAPSSRMRSASSRCPHPCWLLRWCAAREGQLRRQHHSPLRRFRPTRRLPRATVGCRHLKPSSYLRRGCRDPADCGQLPRCAGRAPHPSVAAATPSAACKPWTAAYRDPPHINCRAARWQARHERRQRVAPLVNPRGHPTETLLIIGCRRGALAGRA